MDKRKKEAPEELAPLSIPIPTDGDRWAKSNTSPLENLRRGIDLIRKGKL